MFDQETAHAVFVSGLSDNQSTQSWPIEVWSASWRGPDGALSAGTLRVTGGAWWFRALTDPDRLVGSFAGASSEPLSSAGARAAIAAFVDAANQTLVHWPVAALAPIAFPLREALGPSEALHVLVESLGQVAAAPFVAWLGPVERVEAERLINIVDNDAVVAELARVGGAYELGLTKIEDPAVAASLAEFAPDEVFATWAKDARQLPDNTLFRLRDANPDVFAAVARKFMGKRDREAWKIIAERPIVALVPDVIQRLDDPVAPWAHRFLRNGGEDVVDILVELAQRSTKPGRQALQALKYVDQTLVASRIQALDDDAAANLRETLGQKFDHLPELPRAEWRSWMTAVSQRALPGGLDWLDLDAIPPLATQSGHRLPKAVERGILSLLTEVEFDLSGDGRRGDRYDAVLDELHGYLQADAANAFWNALFAMWWTNHQPDVRWVIYAAAFLCDGPAIRDLGAKLKRHRTWFGHLSPRVIAALGHSPSAWSLAALDDISRRSRNAAHRELAMRFLEGRATAHGLTVDRLIESHFPSDSDPLLTELAAGRLDSAMVSTRAWSVFTWSELMRSEPFRQAGHGVLWSIEDSWGDLHFVRRDEEEFVDVDDERVEPDEEAWVRVAHPAELSDVELRAWSGRFADYELVQPFEQLERQRFRHDSLSKDGFVAAPSARVAGKQLLSTSAAAGWVSATGGAHGDIVAIERRFPLQNVVARVSLTEPLSRDGGGESGLGAVEFYDPSGHHVEPHDVPIAAFSETYRDLGLFTAKLVRRDTE